MPGVPIPAVGAGSAGIASRVAGCLTKKDWKFYAAATVPVVLVAAGLTYYYVAAADKDPKKRLRKRKSGASRAGENLAGAEGAGSLQGAMGETAPKALAADEQGDAQYAIEELTEEQIEAMSAEERERRSFQLKKLGNEAYVAGKYTAAIKIYSHAIALHPDPVYFSNRAACYASLDQHEKVVEDCSAALKQKPGYIKALNRRAMAHEALGHNEDALQDYTNACILDSFRNETTATCMERVLRKVAEGKAKKIMKSKKAKLPSATFIKAYLESFRKLPEDEAESKAQPLTEETADATQEYLRAHALLRERKYSEAVDAANRAVDLGGGNYRAKALALRGTFSFLKGRPEEALRDFESAVELDDKDTCSRIKKASVYMEQGDGDAAFKEFDLAMEAKPEDSDVYYHRGQIRFVIGDFDGAIADYTRSLELDPSSVFSHIQLAVTQYKMDQSEKGGVDRAMRTFAEAMAKFPRSGEIQNYYGEVLLDQGRVDEAAASFDKAIRLDPANPLPYINAALLNFQFRQDPTAADKLIRKAIDVDPECDIAYTTLGQMYLQLGKINEAIELFETAVDMARTEGEAANAIGCREAAMSQIRFATQHPEFAGQLAAARGML